MKTIVVDTDIKRSVLETAHNVNALMFSAEGFKLKSGRLSPYFLNAGLMNDGRSLRDLGVGYASVLINNFTASELSNLVLFGPAYKGIQLATVASIGIFLRCGLSVPVAFNRKEQKKHGDGGILVGGNIKDKNVCIVDDVITSGETIKSTVNFIREHGGMFSKLVVICDRQEKGIETSRSAMQQVRDEYGITPMSIFTFADVLVYARETQSQKIVDALWLYRKEYGVM